MDEPICELWGKPITEAEAEAGNYVDTFTGEWHLDCLEEWRQDADNRTADFWYDYRYTK